ncbi:hypothetical protein [Streptomyces dysideae]|uniref:Uncharacterized protein n=1 Tax=Streptomyces dysideae TaxID=909626 RepID=A0A101UXI6_9ACTN|nr:hypothetical protein [Streptomyces dysideae]KUO18698.1 hypothetical protein AQJ91_23670 [Streptomyces dysideae]
MPEHVSIPQLLGVAVLVLATVVWVVGLTRVLRRSRPGPARWPTDPALPRQRQAAPPRESVPLTPAEQDAFAGLVRQLGDSGR